MSLGAEASSRSPRKHQRRTQLTGATTDLPNEFAVPSYEDQLVQVIDQLGHGRDYRQTGSHKNGKLLFTLKSPTHSVEQQIVIEWTDRNLLLIRSSTSFTVPDGIYRERLAKAIVQTNWGLETGNFEFDMNDGELRYKTSSFFHGMEDIRELSSHLLSSSISLFQKLVPELRLKAIS